MAVISVCGEIIAVGKTQLIYKSLASLKRIVRANYCKKAAVEMQFIGSHRGDLDNLAGAVLDILCETKIVVDDRVSCISRLVIEHEPGSVCGVWVKVNPL
jgi:Holliday junction resolvase RusA-like endonuclease